MRASITVDDQHGRVTIAGTANVSSATQIRAAILECLEKADSVEVAFVDLERADVSLLQILLAAKISAREAGKRLSVSGDLSAVKAAAGGADDVDDLLEV